MFDRVVHEILLLVARDDAAHLTRHSAGRTVRFRVSRQLLSPAARVRTLIAAERLGFTVRRKMRVQRKVVGCQVVAVRTFKRLVT